MVISGSKRQAALKTIAIFGGTFDPVHNGHVQSAEELKQRLVLDELRLLPCHLPAHRKLPGCSSQQRLAMVKLAVAATDLSVDGRELQWDGTSYSVETLEHLRRELGEQVSLIWLMGSDAFAKVDSWYRWRELLTLAHIVVMARPDEPLPGNGAVAELLTQHRAPSAAVLKQQPAGFIWLENLTPYPVSATAIRRSIANKETVTGDVPAAVLNYIETHQLYGS